MKTFELYLKSHCEAPDFEREVEAETKEEALDKIRKETGNSLIEWEDDVLLENMEEIPNEEEEELREQEIETQMRNDNY